MNSRSAVLAILSPLISQLPRRSSASQPNTAGTFGHLAMLRATISSMRLEFPAEARRRTHERHRPLSVQAMARALPGGGRADGGGAAPIGAAGLRRGDRARSPPHGGPVLRQEHPAPPAP